MTQHGDPYENAMAERVNGILKTEFLLNQVFGSFDEASRAVAISVHNYNHLRPHMNGPPLRLRLRLRLPYACRSPYNGSALEETLEAESL